MSSFWLNRRCIVASLTKHRVVIVLTVLLALACLTIFRQTASDVQTAPEDHKQSWHHNVIRSIMRSVTRNSDPYRRRLERVNDVCEEEISDEIAESSARHALGRILVDPVRKLMYCEVEKAASTNILRVLDILDGEYKPENINFSANPRKRQGSVYKKLSQYNKTERYRLMEEGYTKFMFVRHPFSRLVSCFVDKVVQSPDDNFLSVVLRKVRATTGASLNATTLTFQEFADYLMQVEDVNQMGTHYRPIYALCAPCVIKYDFIGKFEALPTDATYIMRKIGAYFGFPSFVPHSTNSSAKKNILKYFSLLSFEQIKALYQLYEYDFKLFGYSIPDYFTSLNESSFI